MTNGRGQEDVASLTERAYQAISLAIANLELKPGESLTQDRLAKWLSMVCDRSFPTGMRPSCQSVRTFWRWADLRKRSSWRQEDTSGWAKAQKTSTGVDGGGVDMLGSSSHMDGCV